jgi:rare lipoprotein A
MQMHALVKLAVGAGAALCAASLSSARADAGADGPIDYGYGENRRGSVVVDLRMTAPTAPSPVVQRALRLRRAGGQAGESAVQGGPERPAWLEQEKVEAPYQSADGVWFVPTAEPGYEQTGKASWYGQELAGRRTASGEPFDPTSLTGAHPTLPLNSLVQVTNLETGAEVMLRINDRGPFSGGRIIDVSRRAAQVLGFERAGEARVHVRYLGPAPKRAGTSGLSTVTQPHRQAQDRSRSRPPGEAGAPQTAAMFVQVGAFSSRQNALRARGMLARAGAVEIVSETRNGLVLHKVRLGPLTDADSAERARRHAVAAGFGDALLVSHRR